VKALIALPGIGESIAKKIDEYFRTGKIEAYDQMKRKYPVDVWEISQIEGIGPKHVYRLWKELDVRTLKGLERAVKEHKIQKLKGFGKKSEEKIANGLGLMKASTGRHPLEVVLPTANLLVKRLKGLKSVKRVSLAGSIRRKKADVGDIDIVATSSDPEAVMDAFTSFPEVKEVIEKGKTKSSVRLTIGIDSDLRVVPDEVYGAALQYFTGDKRHNVLLREMAQKKGYKLNEYGLFKEKKLIACKTEKDIYDALGLKMSPPEKRLGRDEFVKK
jgi:DNA polymerase (family 10)